MATSTIQQTSIAMRGNSTIDYLRWVGIFMAITGFGISMYLSYIKLTDTDVICSNTGVIDCHSVQTSAYATLVGIPIAVLGVAGYGSILAILLLSKRIQFFADYGVAMLFSITLFGFVYSIFLTYVEAFVLEKWCQWCIASALLMTGLFIMSGTQLLRFIQDMESE